MSLVFPLLDASGNDSIKPETNEELIDGRVLETSLREREKMKEVRR